MIYLFRKRNKQIVATTKESAHSMFVTPNNFVTHQPTFLGAVHPADFKAVGEQAEADVPIVIDILVKKDGVDTMVSLDRFQIDDAIANGDKRMEARLKALMDKRQARYNELMEELAARADKSLIPPSYTHKIAAVEDVKGDPKRDVLRGYVHEPA